MGGELNGRDPSLALDSEEGEQTSEYPLVDLAWAEGTVQGGDGGPPAEERLIPGDLGLQEAAPEPSSAVTNETVPDERARIGTEAAGHDNSDPATDALGDDTRGAGATVGETGVDGDVESFDQATWKAETDALMAKVSATIASMAEDGDFDNAEAQARPVEGGPGRPPVGGPAGHPGQPQHHPHQPPTDDFLPVPAPAAAPPPEPPPSPPVDETMPVDQIAIRKLGGFNFLSIAQWTTLPRDEKARLIKNDLVLFLFEGQTVPTRAALLYLKRLNQTYDDGGEVRRRRR